MQIYITYIHENENESVEGNLSPQGKSEGEEDVEVL